MELSFCELRTKSVVNVVDGKDLGRVQDLKFTESGKILGVIVPSDSTGFLGIMKSEPIYIPWKNICKFGDDVILVELSNGENCEE